MIPAELAERLRPRMPEVVVTRGEVTAVVDRDDLLEVLGWVRDDPDLAFDLLASVTATDWPERTPRYWVVYELCSTSFHHRLRLKVGLTADDARLPSATGLYPTADWHERETFDFFGVVFEGHPNLRRIMLPEGWEGYPLRKTEELGGVNTRYRGAFVPPVDRRVSP